MPEIPKVKGISLEEQSSVRSGETGLSSMTRTSAALNNGTNAGFTDKLPNKIYQKDGEIQSL